ncbi:hypothetical protein EGT74_04550 [Chitinophaga lutea]|uniref:Uncharacterized protein n=1 Tax=Chitinophaga lutea TaxID=2488634 RepID=A0A3N4Q0V4_9BACT|nr:hypothetical protein EGT74_04550 [Chitinophaga lutea]
MFIICNFPAAGKNEASWNKQVKNISSVPRFLSFAEKFEEWKNKVSWQPKLISCRKVTLERN